MDYLYTLATQGHDTESHFSTKKYTSPADGKRRLEWREKTIAEWPIAFDFTSWLRDRRSL